VHQTWLILVDVPSTTSSALPVNMSAEPSLDQLRSQLSGKPLVKFEPCRRSDTAMSAGTFENRNDTPTTGGSGFDPNLLSPPLSVESLDTPPFKPVDSDQRSLSMKKRRRRRARRHRDGMDRASTGGAEERPTDPHHTRKRLTSTSVPDLRHDTTSQRIQSAAGRWLMRQQLHALHVAHRRDSIARSAGSRRRASLPQKPRRWTMPSKAAATRVLSESPTPVIIPTIVPGNIREESSHTIVDRLGTTRQSLPSTSQAENNVLSTNRSETPAMITLRRASKKGTGLVTRKTSLRPNAIISFPPPKFNRTTSTYFSSFFGLNSPRSFPRNNDPVQTRVRQSSWSTGLDSVSSLRKASVTADRVQLSANTIAAPAFTQVEFLPISQSHAHRQELLALSARRCSTTIVSGSSVHEIIWDENVTSSSEGSTSADVSRQTSKTAKRSESRDAGRRQSVLMEKLEAQLRNNNLRKASVDSQNSSASSTSADGSGRRKSRLHKLMRWNLGTLDEADRSCQSSSRTDLEPQFNHDLSSDASGLFATLHDEEQLSPTTERVGFFPPLDGMAGNSQRSSVPREQATPELEHVSIEERSSTLKIGAPAASEPLQKVKGKARESSAHFSGPRRPSMGIRQSSHVRWRSTDSHKPTCNSTWSRKASKRLNASEHEEYDEHTPLLANAQAVDSPAGHYVFVGGQHGSDSRAGDAGSRKMSVQDFVHKIERLSQKQIQGWADGSEDDQSDVVRLVRRDGPWLVGTRASAGVAEMQKERERGKVLSEGGEEEGGFVLSMENWGEGGGGEEVIG